MKFLFIVLTMLSTQTAFACWACPEGKVCELIDGPWMSKTELDEFASKSCGGTEGEYITSASTGLSINLICSAKGNQAIQLAPNKVIQVAGESELNIESNSISAIPTDIRTTCSSQAECIKANSENLKSIGQDSQKPENEIGNLRSLASIISEK